MCQVMDLNDNQANVAFTFAKDRCLKASPQAIQAIAGFFPVDEP